MGFYSHSIFPRLCNLLLDRPAVAQLRQELLADVSGEVLEIGFGSGLNLPYYPKSVRKIQSVDPHGGMSLLAKRQIQKSQILVEQRLLSGEKLPFETATFETVVSTFTLCSIASVGDALREIHRVLRPGGRFLFLEHGLSSDPAVQKWQRRLNWLEMHLADGCRLDRDIEALITAQPFSPVRIDSFLLRGFPKTHGTLFRGSATK